MPKKSKQTKSYPNGITIEKINSIRINKSIYTPGSLYIKKPDVYPGVWLITRDPLGIPGQWPSYWHYDFLDEKTSPRSRSGAFLHGGRNIPLLFIGEKWTQKLPRYPINTFSAFLAGNTILLILNTELCGLKKISTSLQYQRLATSITQKTTTSF